MSSTRADSDFEDQALLSDEERVDVGEENRLQLYQAPRRNIAQKILGGTLRFTLDVSAATFFTGLFRDTLGADAGVPGDYAFTTIGMIVGDRVFSIGDAFTKESRPAAYLRAEGEGNVGKGFQNELGRMVVASLPALAITFPLAYGRQMVYEYAMENPAEHLDTLLALNFLETPAVRSLAVGGVSLGTFFLTLKLLDKCIAPRPDVPADERPNLNVFQSIGGVAWETAKALLVYEAIRELMKTNTGPVSAFQTEYALWAAPALAMLYQGLSHLAERPRPFVNIDPNHVPNCGGEEMERRVEILDNDPFSERAEREVSKPKDPAKCRQLGNATLKLTLALGVLTAVVAASHKILAATAGQPSDQNDMPGNYTLANATTAGPLVSSVVDPNAWEMGTRIGVEAAMIGAYYFLSGAVDFGMSMANKAASYCSTRGMFGSCRRRNKGQEHQNSNAHDSDDDLGYRPN